MITVKDVEATAKSLGMEPGTGRSGLLDSGASHAYRQGSEEEITAADRVKVQLANGECVTLAQNRAGTLLATKTTPEDDALPIVPLGSLVQDLHCELTWGRKRGLEIRHPIHGIIRPRVIGKCPLIGETQALQLIKELEDKRVEELQRSTMAMQRALWMWDQDAVWSKHLHTFLRHGGRANQLLALDAEDSPFHHLGPAAKGAMAEDLVLNDKTGWNYLKAIPVSRRKRKLLMANDWVINLFAGPSDGTAELRILEDGCVMLEIDIVRSKAFDLSMANGVFRALMWGAAMGRVKGVMASPPVRSEADEVLVGKAMWCSLVAKAARGFYEESPTFVMFEGAKLMDTVRQSGDCPRFVGLKQAWRRYMEVMCLEEQYGTIATNLDYSEKVMITSTSAGRWTKEFKMGTVGAVMKWMWTPETRQRAKWMAKMDAGAFLSSLSTKELEQWKIHVRNNHTPYNRKCRTCVESSASGRKHTRVKTPSSYCLSLDVCGPFRQRGADPDHSDYRFALVGAYVVPRISHEVPEGGPHNDEVPEGGPHSHEVPEGGPHSHEVPEGGPHSHEVPEGGPRSHEVPEGGPHNDEVPEGGPHSHEVPEGGPQMVPSDVSKVVVVGGDFEPEVECDTGGGVGPSRAWTDGELWEDYDEQSISPEEERALPKGMTDEEFKQVFSEVDGITDYQVMYLSSPLRSRTSRDVLAAVQDMYLRLKSSGYPIVRVHADRARELRCEPLKRWLWSRGTFTTFTEGQAPQSNGRAESAVRYCKTQTKRLLQAAGFSRKLWPLAMRYATWSQMQRQINPEQELIPFGVRAHVKKKTYGVGNRYDLDSKWGTGHYVGPSSDVNGGSVVLMDKGTFITTTHMRPGLIDADEEVELEDYQAIVSLPPKRLRGKSTLDPQDHEGLQPLQAQEDGDGNQNDDYDPNHPAEEYARSVLKEPVILRDYVESLVGLLPQDGPKPKRFGEKTEEEMVWSSGAYVHGGIVGVSVNAKKFPRSTKVLAKYIKNQYPEARFNSLAVFKNIKAEAHKDAHNVGLNVAIPLTDYKDADIVVHEPEGPRVLKVSDGPQVFDPHVEHEVGPCTEGVSLTVVAYSIRDSIKLKAHEVSYLEDLDFTWSPHKATGRDPPPQPGARLSMMKKVEVKKEMDDGKRADPRVLMCTATRDLDIAIQDLEDRAARLRDLLEEEEIMVGQSRRLGEAVREELGDARDYVVKYLEEVHKQLVQFQGLRDGFFLRAARQVDNEGEMIDYEAMLDELEGDLDVVHTVPLDQVKAMLSKWTEAIDKEVKSLFDSGTLTKISQGEARTMERSGDLKNVPSKCVFTLKPPTKPGERGRCRRKCRLVICGNYIAKGEAGEQMDHYVDWH